MADGSADAPATSRLRRLRRFRADLVAGLPGAVSSVPDGMAAGILAGVSPVHGLYASVAGPVAGGLTSSTRLMVVTTTSAAALAAGDAVATVPANERGDALLWLTLLAGALMLLAAVSGLARFLHFVSYSVMLGFLSGVAVNLVLGQLPDLVGADASGSLAATKAYDVLTHPGGIDAAAAACGLGALALLVVLDRTPVAPASAILALAVPTVAALLLDATTVPLVEDGGAIPTGLPVPGLPDLSAFEPSLLAGAAAVAALVLVQGAGVAESAPNHDGRHSAARDFAAQGSANLAAGLVGGMPVGGSVGQTALNVAAGARTRWAAVWCGVWLVLVLVLFADLVGKVALPTLAAVLVYAGCGSLRPREVLAAGRSGPIATAAMLATFLAVLVLPVSVAVGVGVAASLLLQLNQEALDLRLARVVRTDDGRWAEEPAPRTLREQVVVLDVYGSLFYAGARSLATMLPTPGPETPAGALVVLRLRGRTTLGATFLRAVGGYAHQLDAVSGQLFLSGLEPALAARWRRDGTAERLANVRVFPATPVLGESTGAALRSAPGHHRVQALPVEDAAADAGRGPTGS